MRRRISERCIRRKMTYRELLEKGISCLKASGIEEAETDAWVLLSFALGMDRTRYLMDRDMPVMGETKRYRELIGKRAAHIPLQHLTGSQEFMGLEFLVGPEVLIPRQDTETLVELVLADMNTAQGAGLCRTLPVLDMCTGSGCIGISVAKLHGVPVTAVDVSAAALKTAEKNAENLNCREKMDFRLGNLFEPLADGEQYSYLLSNPPYIPSGVIPGLTAEVRDHEPRIALDGSGDGLYFYRRIAGEAGKFLCADGRIYLEIGYDQARAVSALLEENGFYEVRVFKDPAGLDRVVRAVMR